MYHLNEVKIYQLVKEKGFHSLEQVAKKIGVHRNTLQHFLSGHGVFPNSIEKLLEILETKPEEILVKKELPTKTIPTNIVAILDQLLQKYPQSAFCLFGSRAKQKFHRYSDWDIGVSAAHKISHQDFQSMLEQTEQFNEASTETIQLVFLDRADQAFLNNIMQDWKFLCGSLSSWLWIQNKANS